MAVAFVQGTGIQSTGSVASVAKAFVSNPTAGNLLLCGGITDGSGQLGTTAVTGGGTWTRNNVGTFSPAGSTAIYSAPSATGGATTVTCTPTGSAYTSIGICEVSGAHATPLDVAPAGTSGTGTAPTSANLVTTDADFLVGVISHSGANTAIGVTGSFTQIFEDEDASDMPINFAYRIPGASGTYTASWSLAASRDWGIAAAAYKPAADTFDAATMPHIITNRPVFVPARAVGY